MVQAVRDYVMDSIDWDCEINTLFQDHNLGCKHAVSGAISWFFENEEMGIILEDDCLPDLSFFMFCQELLERYKDNEQIMMIAGTNYLFNKVEMKESYYFSKYYAIWGWATWKRAWLYYDVNMSDWPRMREEKYLSSFFCHPRIVAFFEEMANKTYNGQLDTWDIQWVITCAAKSGLAICPKYNLVSNIGAIGTHYKRASRFNFMPVKQIDIPKMVHPTHIIQNTTLDRICFNEVTKTPLWKRVIMKILRLVR
jgi:hypothetical protein